MRERYEASRFNGIRKLRNRYLQIKSTENGYHEESLERCRKQCKNVQGGELNLKRMNRQSINEVIAAEMPFFLAFGGNAYLWGSRQRRQEMHSLDIREYTP